MPVNRTMQSDRFPISMIVLLILLTIFLTAASIRAAEKTMASTPSISSAAEIDYPPFSIVDADGKAAGFSVELLRAALAAMGREVTFRTGPWAEVRGWLERGDVQALPLAGRTPEREHVFDFTFPYMTLHGAIVVRRDTVDIRTLEDLRGRQVAVMQADNAEEFLRRKDRGITIRTTATFEQALHELSQGRHDAMVVQRLVALRLIQKTGLTNLRVIDRPIEGFRQDFCFAVREGDRETLALLNEGLALVMADGTFRHLHAKWFAALQLPTDRRIVVGGDHNYPPYEYLDESGRPAGYNVDITRAIAMEMGLDIDIRLGPWADIVQGLETGEIDVIQGMFYTPERDLTFDFTQAHAQNHYVSVVRKGEGAPPDSFEALKNKRIVIQKADMIHQLLLAQGLAAQVTTVESQEAVLRELATGKHDCALVVRISAFYLMEKNGWTNLQTGRRPFLATDYCYAVMNGRKALLTTFSEGLQILNKTGERHRIYEKWMGGYSAPRPALIAILWYVALVAAPLLVLLLGIFLWSWSLRKQVARKTGELKHSEEFQRTMIACSPVALLSIDLQGRVLSWNQSAERIFGWTAGEIIGKPLPIVPDNKREESEGLRQSVSAGQTILGRDVVRIRKDGTRFDGSLSAAPIRDEAGRVIGIMVAMADISERKHAEAERVKLQSQLLQAQKMESVGRLAGGVAHDYNNMLSVIMGYTELAVEKLDQQDPLYADLAEILTAAKRSADLTRQLLAFSRQQTIAPKVLDLNETVEGMLKMLRRLVGEDIDLAWRPRTGLWPVMLDPSQLDQILANLCINARDAIADVGKVTIETGKTTFDEAYCADHAGFVPGDFVMLAVSDDGCGMYRETLDKIFEPFFTTKGIGQGTGLGLATVYGIVKQNKGFINVYSEPDKGTTFRIYLARHVGEAVEPRRPDAEPIPPCHGETVLVVEDDPAILKLAERLLSDLGYRVLLAGTPTAALQLAEAHSGAIDLLMTDVIMPGMNGRELSLRLQSLNPDLKVLFMSGYTANVIAHRGVLDDGVNFIQKPFSKKGLAAKIRATLGL